MTEQFNEQISQFIDDEMSPEESDFFVRRLQSDAEARRQYLRYQLIGAAVRGENTQPATADLGRRFEQSLEQGETARTGSGRWPQLATGVGIAASVALVAVFALQFVNFDNDSLLPASSDASGQIDLRSNFVPPSPAGSPQLVRVSAEATGIQYLIHHARYSSGVSRAMMQSSVIAAQQTDPTLESLQAGAPLE